MPDETGARARERRGGRHAGAPAVEEPGEAGRAEPRGRHRGARAGTGRRRAEQAWGMRPAPAAGQARGGGA
jgi:hypothetical protein